MPQDDLESAVGGFVSNDDGADTGGCEESDHVDPCHGYRHDASRPCPIADVHVGPGKKDILPLRTLLFAAGIKDLDTEGDYTSKAGQRQSYRKSGMIFHVTIFYTNVDDGLFPRLKQYKYHYAVTRVPETQFSVEENRVASLGENARTIIDRNGIRLIFTISGSIGRPAWLEAIPVALAASLSILAMLISILNNCVLGPFWRGKCGKWQQQISTMYDNAKYDIDYRGKPTEALLLSSGGGELQQRGSTSGIYGDITSGLRL